MEYQVVDTPEEMAKAAAQRVKDVIERKVAAKGYAVIGLPTGSTPIPLYDELVRMNQAGELSFKNVITFNLDEYVGDDQYKRFMHEQLFDRLRPEDRPKEIHIPNGLAADPHQEAKDYEEAIKRAGGIDLQILGIGVNGHLGFNEPNKQQINSPTHVVDLDPETIRINTEKFGKAYEKAITMGISTIMKAKEILLLASGEEKAPVLADTRGEEKPTTPSILTTPSKILSYHKNATAVIDRQAAKEMGIDEQGIAAG